MAAYRLHYFPASGNSYKLALMRGAICRNYRFQQVALTISSLHCFASVRDPFASFRDPLHFDNTFLENDDPQLSCLA